jgi:hypothetical protein
MLEDPEADLQMKLDAAAIDAQIQILERQLQETNEALAQLRAMRRGTEHGG